MIRGGERSADGQRAGTEICRANKGGEKKKKKNFWRERERVKRWGGRAGEKQREHRQPGNVFNIHEMSPFSFFDMLEIVTAISISAEPMEIPVRFLPFAPSTPGSLFIAMAMMLQWVTSRFPSSSTPPRRNMGACERKTERHIQRRERERERDRGGERALFPWKQTGGLPNPHWFSTGWNQLVTHNSWSQHVLCF